MTKNRRETIMAILTEHFAPSYLDVEDESAKHAGHAGARPEGQTHYRVKISARHFDGMTRVAQHRAVMAVLHDEFKAGLHALAIEIVVGAPKDTVVNAPIVPPEA